MEYLDSNKMNKYSELIARDAEYEIEYSIALTYSLDFETLLSVLLSLNGITNDEDQDNKDAIYDAISKNQKKFLLFCNSSGIKCPSQNNKIFSLVDDNIICVNDENILSFHPKLFINVFKNENGEELVEIVVLSKNITFDNSLDVGITLCGKVSKNENNKKNDQVIGLLNYLKDYLNKQKNQNNQNKSKIIDGIIEKVKNVASFEIDGNFSDYRFLPIGINKDRKIADKIVKDAKKVIIVSPFLSSNLIEEKVKKDISEKILITRVESIDKKIIDMFKDGKSKIYVMRDGLGNNDYIDDEESCDEVKNEEKNEKNQDGKIDDSNVRDIHAKIIFKETSKGDDYLYIGSLNATNSAFYNNIELMIELKLKDKNSFDKFKDMLLGIDKENRLKGFFEEYSGNDNDVVNNKDEKNIGAEELNNAIRNLSAKVEKNKDDKYKIIVNNKLKNDKLSIKPYYYEGNLEGFKNDNEVVFDGLDEDEVSSYYVLKYDNGIGTKEFIKTIYTEGIDREKRDKAVLNAIMVNEKDVNEHIRYILSDENNIYLNRHMKQTSKSSKIANGIKVIEPAVFELLLKSASKDKKCIGEIEDFINKIDGDKISEKFKNMIHIFKEVYND